MKVIKDNRVSKFLELLSKTERSRIEGYVSIFCESKFLLTGKYLKKITGNLWELRPGNIRVLFGFAGDTMIIVNIFKKKTQKTPKQEIKIALNRLKEYGI